MSSITSIEQERARLTQLGNLDPTFLLCRDLSHAWERVASVVSERRGDEVTAITRTCRCIRCDTEKDQVFGVPTYETISTTYRYPEGYQMRGAGYTPRHQIRREMWRRTNYLLNEQLVTPKLKVPDEPQAAG